MNQNIKNNTSEYWSEINYDISTFSIYFNENITKSQIEENSIDFIYNYTLLSFKFGMLMPYNISLCDNLYDKIHALVQSDHNEYPEGWPKFIFNKLFSRDNHLVCQSNLFIKKKGRIKNWNIVNTELLKTVEQSILSKDIYAEAVKINFIKDHFVITFNSDALFSNIKNKKTSYCNVDNSETAYLNTTRFNSFLRDFKELCFKYFESNFFFEKIAVDFITEEGILIDNEIVFYEDIYNLLNIENKYKAYELME